MKSEITINGVKQPLYFGMKAIAYIFQQPEILEMMEGKPLDETQMAIITFGGYKNQCLLDRVPEALNYSDFFLICENAYIDGKSEEMQAIANAFTASKFVKKIEEKTKEILSDEESKKNLISTLSSDSVMENSD